MPAAKFILLLGQAAFGRVNRVIFFTISGYLFFWTLRPVSASFLKKWRKRITSLVLPFLLWSGLSVAAFLLGLMVPAWRAMLGTRHGFDGSDIWQVLDLLLVHPIPYQFWYVRDLCVYIVLSPSIYWLALRFGSGLVTVMLGLWIMGQGLQGMAPSGLCFLTIGAVLAVKGKVPDWDLRRSGRWALWIWGTICVSYTLLRVMEIDMPALIRVGSLFGLVAVWALLDLIPLSLSLRTWLLRHSPFTFFVFALHEPLLSGIRRSLFLLFPLNGLSAVLVFLVLPWIVLACCLKCGCWLKTAAPKIYSVLTGARG